MASTKNHFVNDIGREQLCQIIGFYPDYATKKEIRAEEAGASVKHNLIVANLIAILHRKFKDGCCLNRSRQEGYNEKIKQCIKFKCYHVFPSDVYVPYNDGNNNKDYFPDVLIVKGKPELINTQKVVNPNIIFEVISPSQRDSDMEQKLENYEQHTSLDQFITIDSTKKRVRVYEQCVNEKRCDLTDHILSKKWHYQEITDGKIVIPSEISQVDDLFNTCMVGEYNSKEKKYEIPLDDIYYKFDDI